MNQKVKLYFYSIFTFLIIFTFWFISKGGLVLEPVVKPKPIESKSEYAQRIDLIKQGVANLVRLLRGQALIVGEGQTNEDIKKRYLEEFIEKYKFLLEEQK